MNVEKMLDPVKKYLDNAFLPDFLRSEENINQINDAYLSNNQKLYRECIMLRMGNKTMEECSKSCFSHLRDDVEKMTLRPLISERFLAPTSAQDREKVV